jgi:hypothetical protein
LESQTIIVLFSLLIFQLLLWFWEGRFIECQLQKFQWDSILGLFFETQFEITLGNWEG